MLQKRLSYNSNKICLSNSSMHALYGKTAYHNISVHEKCTISIFPCKSFKTEEKFHIKFSNFHAHTLFFIKESSVTLKVLCDGRIRNFQL